MNLIIVRKNLIKLYDALYVEEMWCEITSLPEEDPLGDLGHCIEEFRECGDCVENGVADYEKLKHFVLFVLIG